MNCKECIYTKCLMRTEGDFETCPVEVAKQKREESKKDSLEN
ncbi:hypothetical protein [uncultured Clostridium sp.]|nr:hypothetical protein [uncultured Clostridium sp.]